MCYIIDWGVHIIAIDLITTRGWVRAMRERKLYKNPSNLFWVQQLLIVIWPASRRGRHNKM